MRLLRFEDEHGAVGYGRVTGDDLTTAEWLVGSPFDELVPEGRTATVKKILSPLAPTDLGDILCIGLNYRKHADESNMSYPERPILFAKTRSTVIGPDAEIVCPAISTEVDYEAELAVIIGKAAKGVSEADALDYVYGYTVANDVSARDWQLRLDRQWVRGKSFDTFCPLGPVIVTADEIPNPNALRISLNLSGETVQDSNTVDMIFHVAQVVSYLSQGMTLQPGTVILTGTPEGVGMGRTPNRWLKHGDVCEVTIENIGTLRNPVVSEAGAS
jgi:2-keto-4-pentenoate hydratase/2-oxohepta-3-ene-1,7-dioic acid hydratase in catechol pathway